MTAPIRVAWVGPSGPPAPLGAVDVSHVACAEHLLEHVDAGNPPPHVVVAEWTDAEAVATLKRSNRLRGLPLIVVGTDHDLPWRAAEVGAFCCSAGAPEPLARAIVAAAKVNLEPTPWLNGTAMCARALMRDATFELRTPSEADALAHYISAGLDDPPRRVTGVLELLLNAIEHGNLAIDGASKQALLARGAWEAEVAQRLATAPYAARRVLVQLTTQADAIALTIEDDGAGFDARPFVEQTAALGTGLRGRGIALARLLSFDTIEYQGRGNRVVATIRLGARHE